MAVAPSEALEVSAVGAAAPWSCSVTKSHPEAGAPCSHVGAVPVLQAKARDVAPAEHSPIWQLGLQSGPGHREWRPGCVAVDSRGSRVVSAV